VREGIFLYFLMLKCIIWERNSMVFNARGFVLMKLNQEGRNRNKQ